MWSSRWSFGSEASRFRRLAFAASSRPRPNRAIVLGAMEQDIEAALQRSFLGRLPSDLVDGLVEGQLRMDVPADTTIYREGEASRAFLIISGLFRLFLVSGDGRQVTIRYGRPSDVHGTALVVGGPLDVRAQTLAPSTILGIDVGRLEEATRRDAAVAYALSEGSAGASTRRCSRSRSTPSAR